MSDVVRYIVCIYTSSQIQILNDNMSKPKSKQTRSEWLTAATKLSKPLQYNTVLTLLSTYSTLKSKRQSSCTYVELYGNGLWFMWIYTLMHVPRAIST